MPAYVRPRKRPYTPAQMPFTGSFLASAPFAGSGEILGALCALLWACATIVFARLPTSVSASALNLGKNLTASLCFLVLVWTLSGSPWPHAVSTHALVLLVLSGVLGLTLCDTLMLRSLMEIGPQRMSTVFLLVPVLTALAAMLPPFSEFPPWHTWLGMCVTLGGIFLALSEPHGDPVRRGNMRRGVRLALGAAALQAIGLLLTRRATVVDDHDPLLGASLRMLSGTLGLVLLGLFVGRLRAWGRQIAPRRIAGLIFVAAFFGTFLGIWTNQMALAWSVHTGVAVMLTSLMPIYLIPLSTVFLSERFGGRAWTGTLIALGGVALMLM